MSFLRKYWEKRMKDDREQQRLDDEEDEELDEEEDDLITTALAMQMEEESQRPGGSRQGRAPNIDRRRHARGENLREDYFIPNPIYPVHFFRQRYRMGLHVFDRIMTDLCNHNDYFVQKPDALGQMGLLPEQKITAVLRMLAYGAAADQVDEITRLGKSTALDAFLHFCDGIVSIYRDQYLRRPTSVDLRRLLEKGDQRGFPGMIGSIDCMHWEWKNCPTAWHGAHQSRKGTKTLVLEAVASFDTWIWHAFFGCPGSQNDINVLNQSDVFAQVEIGNAPPVNYTIHGYNFTGAYYLADGIYPRWSTFVKSISKPHGAKEKLYAAKQEAYRKDVERAFGILQARWGIVRGAVRMWNKATIWKIMMTCIILHNMIVEDEYDYDGEEVLEEDPYNTSATRVYDAPLVNGQPLQYPPLGRDWEMTRRIINRYIGMQDPQTHVVRQAELVEHIWDKEREG